MEGLITCLFGIAGYFLIVDFPELAATSFHFLSERESAFIVARIEKDRADAILEPFAIGAYLKNALDLKVWAFGMMFCLSKCTYFVNWLPLQVFRAAVPKHALWYGR